MRELRKEILDCIKRTAEVKVAIDGLVVILSQEIDACHRLMERLVAKCNCINEEE